MSGAPETTSQWVMWGIGIFVTIMLSIGGFVISSMSNRMDRLEDNLYKQTSVSITEDKLTRLLEYQRQYFDSRLQSVENTTQSLGQQLGILTEDQKEFQKEMRDIFRKQ